MCCRGGRLHAAAQPRCAATLGVRIHGRRIGTPSVAEHRSDKIIKAYPSFRGDTIEVTGVYEGGERRGAGGILYKFSSSASQLDPRPAMVVSLRDIINHHPQKLRRPPGWLAGGPAPASEVERVARPVEPVEPGRGRRGHSRARTPVYFVWRTTKGIYRAAHKCHGRRSHLLGGEVITPVYFYRESPRE